MVYILGWFIEFMGEPAKLWLNQPEHESKRGRLSGRVLLKRQEKDLYYLDKGFFFNLAVKRPGFFAVKHYLALFGGV